MTGSVELKGRSWCGPSPFESLEGEGESGNRAGWREKSLQRRVRKNSFCREDGGREWGHRGAKSLPPTFHGVLTACMQTIVTLFVQVWSQGCVQDAGLDACLCLGHSLLLFLYFAPMITIIIYINYRK